MRITDEQKLKNRLADVRFAISQGKSLSWLSDKWNICRPAATQWCARYVSEDDHKQLAENGVSSRYDEKASTPDRLALISLCRSAGWSDTRIARAIGVGQSAISVWLKNNAPDGIEAALADFTDEPETINWDRTPHQQHERSAA